MYGFLVRSWSVLQEREDGERRSTEKRLQRHRLKELEK